MNNLCVDTPRQGKNVRKGFYEEYPTDPDESDEEEPRPQLKKPKARKTLTKRGCRKRPRKQPAPEPDDDNDENDENLEDDTVNPPYKRGKPRGLDQNDSPGEEFMKSSEVSGASGSQNFTSECAPPAVGNNDKDDQDIALDISDDSDINAISSPHAPSAKRIKPSAPVSGDDMGLAPDTFQTSQNIVSSSVTLMSKQYQTDTMTSLPFKDLVDASDNVLDLEFDIHHPTITTNIENSNLSLDQCLRDPANNAGLTMENTQKLKTIFLQKQFVTGLEALELEKRIGVPSSTIIKWYGAMHFNIARDFISGHISIDRLPQQMKEVEIFHRNNQTPRNYKFLSRSTGIASCQIESYFRMRDELEILVPSAKENSNEVGTIGGIVPMPLVGLDSGIYQENQAPRDVNNILQTPLPINNNANWKSWTNQEVLEFGCQFLHQEAIDNLRIGEIVGHELIYFHVGDTKLLDAYQVTTEEVIRMQGFLTEMDDYIAKTDPKEGDGQNVG